VVRRRRRLHPVAVADLDTEVVDRPGRAVARHEAELERRVVEGEVGVARWRFAGAAPKDVV